jgi:Haemolysin-III related
MNHSKEVFAWGISLDFQRILILMYTATIPIIYYGFVCTPNLQKVYWALISIFHCVVGYLLNAILSAAEMADFCLGAMTHVNNEIHISPRHHFAYNFW